MLQQTEVTELIEDLNRRQDGKSFSYALILGFLALTIMMFGLTMLYSTSFATVGEKYFHAQLKWAAISLVAMTGVIFIGYKRLASWSPWMMIILIALLIWAAFFSPTVKGANRWIIIPGMKMQFQPSELAKVVLALFSAKVFSENLRTITNWRHLKAIWLPITAIGSVLALVLAGHDLGTTLLLSTAMLSIAFSGGFQKRVLVLVIPIALLGLAGYLLDDPERISRITSIVNPGDESVRDNDGYQLWNSLLALGSGGWKGIGFMESMMKHRYLPESHTDFILAVVGEELGYIGLLGVITAYLLLGYCGLKIALNNRTRMGTLLAQTLTLIIVLQAGINIGVVSGALPTKGISAPLISYGGSGLLINMILIGLLISVGLENVPGLTDKWPGRKKRE